VVPCHFAWAEFIPLCGGDTTLLYIYIYIYIYIHIYYIRFVNFVDP
jgi:hypothetical protein